MPLPSWMRSIRWPPFGLGLGTPVNLAVLSPARRARLGPTLLLAIAVGLATVLVILVLDRLWFGGDSLPRIRALGALPLGVRLGAVVVSSLAEELIYRVGLATLVAALAFLALRGRSPVAASLAIWVGIGAAAFLFGLAHVGNAPGAAHPVARALILDGLAGVVLGWLYWHRGLEAALLAHLAGDALIYLLLAGLL